jgi:hypothetical protein
MEIAPATIAQVRLGATGKSVTVEDDVGDIARRIKEIDPALSLHWSDPGQHFYVMEDCKDGKPRMVLTCNELDNRLIDRLRMLASPDHDYIAEVDRLDDAAQRAKDHAFHEQTGEIGERLAHAVRKDLQAKNKIILPRGV